jgi:prepilin-type N-terminal cleavage/methylation domain-containing protein
MRVEYSSHVVRAQASGLPRASGPESFPEAGGPRYEVASRASGCCTQASHTQRGASLIESLVALALFGIAAAAISNLLTHHIRREATNGTTTTAVAVAEAELESLRSLDYPDIVTRTTNPTPAAGSPAYRVQTTVVADSPAPSLKTISTRVSWTEAAGPKSVTLDAVYTDVTR